MRIVHVAVDAAFQRLLGGDERVARLVRERARARVRPRGGRLPRRPRRARSSPSTSTPRRGRRRSRCEPRPWLVLEGEALDRGLAAMGNFADLISPYLSGHSTGVAELAEAAARRCGLDATRVVAVRRAGLVHDLGRVAIHARIWQKPGPLTADELGAGAAASLPLRARARAVAVPCGAGAGGGSAPRAPRRLGLPPRATGRTSAFPRACSPRPTPTTR